MKNVLLVIVLFTVITSCNNTGNTNTNPAKDTAITQEDTAVEIKTAEGTSCFAYLQNRDTVLMKLYLTDSIASGTLVYNIYEKDKNKGTFKGLLHGDTLLVTYNYFSEGRRSLREVAFLIKGNILVQGTGSMQDENGKLVFSNRRDLNFNNVIILESVDCDKFSKE